MAIHYLDCKAVAEEVRASCKAEVRELKEMGITPKLAIVRVGEKGPDLSYEKGAVRTMTAAGIETEVFAFPADISQKDYIREFRRINANPDIHGILALRPLDHIDENEAIGRNLDSIKDVDASTAGNIGKLLLGDRDAMLPCTAEAIMAILDYYAEDIRRIRRKNNPYYYPREGEDALQGLEVCIVNNSHVIGIPLMVMLTERFATVSVVHHLSEEADKKAMASRADVVIAATPFRNTVTQSMIKPGAMVIDAAVIREKLTDESGAPVINPETGEQKTAIFGCCTPRVAEKADCITPVPGVGSVTSAMLARNLLQACRMQSGRG
ncbi:MAG: bifunctional 5,10-methylenetetrahydrofolate dehydrogenase/5,10-methenyltetrahydrofolate cyclohydrolase [Clostridium sp.]|nr:bifunctional 5,10-methylenetetrahydrofolate dehydrogenase/5,10-methenyltetrahydrofolate cyclohydrolase [Clostridium sp.]